MGKKMLSKIIARRGQFFFNKARRFSSLATEEIKVTNKMGFFSLTMNLPDGTHKRFLINEKMTFDTLKEMLDLENPVFKTTLDFRNVKAGAVNEGTSILKFLMDEKTPGHVEISLNEDKTYTLGGLGNSTSLNFALKTLEEVSNDPSSPLYWYNKGSQQNLDQDLRPLLSHYAATLQNRFLGLKSASAYTDKEINEVLQAALANYGHDFERNIEELTHRLNEVESTIAELERERETIEEGPRRRIHLYLWGIVGLSIVHIISFYYMIFHVDWLGWDIIEPLTYSIAQFSVFLVILYWARFGKARSVEAIIKNFVERKINGNKLLRKRFELLNRLLEENYTKRRQLRGFIDLNRTQHNRLRLNDLSESLAHSA
eukprot:TRINITY_DN7058_c0_g1_i1.p1 TRINITY_DN7058_c0_g1~~TRINITY_DN7058_c0_g1_i1.p1  ORF type:complete len:372 (+),score=99.74 TRINITY_DN7058_c0_g1_i1:35-1150(+)